MGGWQISGNPGRCLLKGGQSPKRWEDTMERLSTLDASFLYMEAPETPMHVADLGICSTVPGYGRAICRM